MAPRSLTRTSVIPPRACLALLFLAVAGLRHGRRSAQVWRSPRPVQPPIGTVWNGASAQTTGLAPGVAKRPESSLARSPSVPCLCPSGGRRRRREERDRESWRGACTSVRQHPGPPRLSGDGFRCCRLPRAEAYRDEPTFDAPSCARAAEPPGQPSGALPLNLARCAQPPPRSGLFR